MSDKKFNLFGFNIRDNNNSRTRGQTNVDYSLGKMRNSLGSTTRIYKHCSKYSSDPLNCTFSFAINSSNQLANLLPITPPVSPPVNLIIPYAPTILNATIANGETLISFSSFLNTGLSIMNYE